MSEGSRSISIAEWLAARAPSAPDVLANRLRDLAGTKQCLEGDLPQSLIEIASAAFSHLDDSRDSALELLAADALITYAMEAAAELGNDRSPRDAMIRLSAAAP
jgi:hypothetical protein